MWHKYYNSVKKIIKRSELIELKKRRNEKERRDFSAEQWVWRHAEQVQPDLEELTTNMEDNEEAEKEEVNLGKLQFSMDYDFQKSEVCLLSMCVTCATVATKTMCSLLRLLRGLIRTTVGSSVSVLLLPV